MGRRNRQFTTEFKSRVALEAIKGRKTISQIASEFDVHPTQINNWKKQAINGIKVGISKPSTVGSHDGGEQKRMDGLYKQIGKLQVENDFLRNAVYPDTA